MAVARGTSAHPNGLDLRRSTRVKKHPKDRTTIGAWSHVATLKMRSEASQVVAVAEATAAAVNQLERDHSFHASVAAFAATKAVAEMGDVELRSARAHAAWRPGGHKQRQLAKDVAAGLGGWGAE